MYTAEEKIGMIIQISTLLTISLLCLDCWSVPLHCRTAHQEIGIRKIVGASVGSVLQCLQEFALLILIAFIIAVPVAWWRLGIWLDESFIYHEPRSDILPISGIVAIVIGMGTISFYILKVATGNPWMR